MKHNLLVAAFVAALDLAFILIAFTSTHDPAARRTDARRLTVARASKISFPPEPETTITTRRPPPEKPAASEP